MTTVRAGVRRDARTRAHAHHPIKRRGKPRVAAAPCPPPHATLASPTQMTLPGRSVRVPRAYTSPWDTPSAEPIGMAALEACIAALFTDADSARQTLARLLAHPYGKAWVATCLANGDGGTAAFSARARVRELHPLVPPVVAVVVASLLGGTDTWLSRRRRRQFMVGLEMLDPAEALAYARLLRVRPDIASRLRRQYCVQERMELHPRGDSLATFLPFIRPLHATPARLADSTDARTRFEGTPVPHLADAAPLAGLENGWQAHGRTLHFRAPSGASMGLKLAKAVGDDLQREARMGLCFAYWQQEFELTSRMPTILGMVAFRPTALMREAIAAEASRHGTPSFALAEGETVEALLFASRPDYFMHLHDLPAQQDLATAFCTCARDVAILAARAGLVNRSPADFYHNEQTQRRYYWNVDHVQRAVGRRIGAGRCDRIDLSIENINFGSQLRDPKGYTFVADMAQHYNDDARLALVSLLGDSLFSLTLSAAKWFVDRHRTDDVDGLADILRRGYSAFLVAYTQQEQGRDLIDAIVDFDLMAQQLLYFMTPAYVHDLARGRVRRDMCGKHVALRAQIPHVGWQPTQGWMLDGRHRDLGPKNGPLPLPELIAALYVTTEFAVSLR